MEYLWASLFTVFGVVCLVTTLVGLPGNWLLLIGTLVYWWLLPDELAWWWLVVVLGLALIGELVEFLAGVAGAKTTGGSRWGAGGALAGGLLGAVVGTFALPLPVVGTLVGACLGAALGAGGLEMWKGQRTRQDATRIAVGAGVGRFVGTLAKLAAGGLAWVCVSVAAFWP